MKIWKDKISEKEIKKLFSKNKERLKVPEELNERVLHVIRSQEKEKGKKKYLSLSEIFLKPVIVFSIVLLLFVPVYRFLFVPQNEEVIFSKALISVGNVIHNRNGFSQKLFVGKKLFNNDKIITDKHSRCKIEIADNNAYILISENSSISLKELSSENNKNTSIYLEKGKIYVGVNKILKNSKFKVITDKGITTVKGTKFLVESFPGKKTMVLVKEGKVKTEITGSPHNAFILEQKEKVLIENNKILKNKIDDKEMKDSFKEFSDDLIEREKDVKNEEYAKLNVRIETGISEISIKNIINEKTDKIDLLLKPGKYKLLISKSGYKSLIKDFQVDKDDSIEMVIKLQKIIIKNNDIRKREKKEDIEKDSLKSIMGNKFGIFPFKLIAEFNGHKYFISTQKMHWHEALKECSKYGGYLVSITSKKENTIIDKAILDNKIKGSIWIGASDKNDEGNWIWVTGENFKFSNWDYMEPNNGQIHLFGGADAFAYQNYGIILNKKGNLKWNDVTSTENNLFIMEVGR